MTISGDPNNKKPYKTLVTIDILMISGDQNNGKPYNTLIKVDIFTVQGARSRSRKRGPEAGRPKSQRFIKKFKLEMFLKKLCFFGFSGGVGSEATKTTKNLTKL